MGDSEDDKIVCVGERGSLSFTAISNHKLSSNSINTEPYHTYDASAEVGKIMCFQVPPQTHFSDPSLFVMSHERDECVSPSCPPVVIRGSSAHPALSFPQHPKKL